MQQISIHALREEGDLRSSAWVHSPWTISIHALREEGDMDKELLTVQDVEFQSTPSVRRATARAHFGSDPLSISIHALREEGDRFTAMPN